ncbi:nickel pincer cofactor-dependent isomerase, group 22 [Halovulum sp. GXIMD14794]
MDTSPRFPAIELPHLAKVPLPDFAEVRIRQPDPAPLADVPAAVRAALDTQSEQFDLPPGASVAVAVGSRGIAGIDIVARTAVDWLKARGLAPFIVPGMGSHGGGTAEGQAEVLANLGITDESMGCPVRATMETAQYGKIEGGFTCHFDANAAGADGVLVINRVKAHTSFDRPVESGLSKMLAVGLGKAEGARQVHMVGPRGLAETLPRLAARIVERAPLCAGLALVETADKHLHHIEAVAPRDFAETDARLLTMAKAAMARLPFAQLDGLIVEEVGKDVSGAGIDPAISGRTDIRGVENPAEPFIHKIVVLGLSARTGGNGLGVGMGDYIPRALAESLDLKAMYMNAVSATILEKAFIPIVLPDEITCVRALAATCWADGPPRLAQIRSSAQLGTIRVTAPLLEELRSRDLLLSETPLAPLAFDAGRLARIGAA